MNRRLSVLFGWLLLLAASTGPAAEATPVHPARGDWQARYQAFARVTALAETRIKLPFPVRIRESAIAPGQPVAKGEVLLRFDAPKLYQTLAAYRDARQAARLSRKRLGVLRSNREEHTVTRRELLAGAQDLAAAEARETDSWSRLQADLAVLESRLDRATVDGLLDQGKREALEQRMRALHAPFSGVVVYRPPPAGAWVDSGENLVELEDLSRVYVLAGVPEAQLADWRGGDTRLTKGAQTLPLVPLPGAPGLDPDSGLRLLRYLSDNPGGRLRDGQWVRVVHRTAPRPVLWVPEAAVVSRNGRSWCLVVEDGGIEPVAVKTGPAEQGRVPVLSGLKPEQMVVVQGAYEWLYRDLEDLIRFVD